MSDTLTSAERQRLRLLEIHQQVKYVLIGTLLSVAVLTLLARLCRNCKLAHACFKLTGMCLSVRCMDGLLRFFRFLKRKKIISPAKRRNVKYVDASYQIQMSQLMPAQLQQKFQQQQTQPQPHPQPQQQPQQPQQANQPKPNNQVQEAPALDHITQLSTLNEGKSNSNRGSKDETTKVRTTFFPHKVLAKSFVKSNSLPNEPDVSKLQARRNKFKRAFKRSSRIKYAGGAMSTNCASSHANCRPSIAGPLSFDETFIRPVVFITDTSCMHTSVVNMDASELHLNKIVFESP